MIVVLTGYTFSFISQSWLNKIILAVNMSTPLFLFLSYYHRLRHLGVFLIWIVIGVAHVLIMTQLAQTGTFKTVRGDGTDGMFGIIMALGAFLFAQVISHYLFKQEFIAAAYFSPSDKREKNFIDYVLTFIGMGAIAMAFIIHHL